MESRRRLDQVLAPGFVEDLEAIGLDELRQRRQLAREVENELSYYRRLLHGRIDLLEFELRRRRGAEERSLIEALPEILSGGDQAREWGGRARTTDLPPFPEVGRREIDHVLGDDVLIRLDEIDYGGLERALEGIRELESDISRDRQAVQRVEDRLSSELSSRYQAGAAG